MLSSLSLKFRPPATDHPCRRRPPRRRRRKTFPAEFSGELQKASSSPDLPDHLHHSPPLALFPSPSSPAAVPPQPTPPSPPPHRRHHHHNQHHHSTTHATTTAATRGSAAATAAPWRCRLVVVLSLVLLFTKEGALVGWQPPRGALVGAVTAQGAVWLEQPPHGVRLF
ncbi:hypothetical protein Tco_0585837 [Tanacetum coccineum]